jgi:hypothetical protein
MAKIKPTLSLVQAIKPQEITDASDAGSTIPDRKPPDANTMATLIEQLRSSESQYGQVPNTEITKQRLLNKYQQDLAQRGEMSNSAGAHIESHPILADYLRGLADREVSPSTEYLTPEERQQVEQELQYQHAKRLERQLQMSKSNSLAPTLTR